MGLFSRGFQNRVKDSEISVIPSCPITLDSQQKSIVYSTEQNIIVVAGAGSGKTRVLTERVKYLISTGVQPSNVVAITFTNLAAEEMRDRLKDVDGIGDAFIGTIHSFANKVMQLSGEEYSLYNDELDNSYHKYLIERYCNHLTFDRFLQYKDLMNSMELGRVSEREVSSFFSPSEMAEYNLLHRKGECSEDDSTLYQDYPETIYTLCKRDNVISFDELLVKADHYFRGIDAKVEHLLVDEFQDVGTLEFRFIEGLSAENNFFVGDDWQCQPKGSRVLLKTGEEVPIESLHIGDEVCGYDLNIGRFSKAGRYSKKGYPIYNMRSFIYEGELVEVTSSSGRTSRYTPKHRTFVRINKDTEYRYILYLMRNSKGRYRIGTTTLFSAQSHGMFGLRQRMREENCSDAWILKVFKTREEALVWEYAMSVKFQIPQIIFQGSKVFDQSAVSFVYSQIDNIGLNAEKCLTYFHRDVRYPLVCLNDNRHFTRNAMVDIQSCNIIPDVMNCIEYNPTDFSGEIKDRRKYPTIVSVTYPKVCEEVYCIEVSTVHNYVSDGVLTCNSIYGFKGGNVELFMRLVEDSNFATYYLTNNYRNGSQIIALANNVIGQVSNKIDKSVTCKVDYPGEFSVSTKKKVYEEGVKKILDEGDYRNWFILARTNKELFSLADILSRSGVPYVTFKREGLSLSELNRYMASNRVKLLTVHTSKGLEADNVILYGRFPITCPSYLRDEDERKVMYVGITRARKRLIILN